MSKKTKQSSKLNSTSVALAGEFLVLAKLTALGHIATLTLGNTKSVDILLSNPKTEKMYRVEVKTSSKGPYKGGQFGHTLDWHMHEKHEGIKDKDLYYCFVFWNGADIKTARFFVVPSKEVAEYVRKQDIYYHDVLPHKKPTKRTPLRMFRVALVKGAYGLEAEKYEDRWDYFDN